MSQKQQYHTEVKPGAIEQLPPLTKDQVQQVAQAAQTAGEDLLAIDPRTNPDGYPPAKP